MKTGRVAGHRIVVTTSILLALLFPAAPLHADKFLLGDGSAVEGKLLSETKIELVVETFHGSVTLKKSEVKQRNRAKSDYENYLDKLSKLKDGDVKGILSIGQWCKGKQQYELARKHLQDALRLEPDNKKAKTEIEHIERAIEEEFKKTTVPLTINVGVKQKVEQKEMDRIVGETKKMSARLAEITGGIMYLAEATFTVGGDNGDLVYDKDFTGLPNGATNIPMGTNNWWASVILHEYGHAKLNLGDEYTGAGFGSNKGETCPNCIMALKSAKGFCSKSNHNGNGNNPGCQEILTRRFPQLAKGFARSPEETAEFIKRIPEMKVIINGTK